MPFAALLDHLRDHPVVRRVAWLGFLSLIAAVTLSGYTFGLSEGFWGRTFSTLLVFWLLALGTVFGIRPLLVWLTRRLGGPVASRAPRTRKAPPSRPTNQRTPAPRWR